MTGKNILMRNKDLASWWGSIASDNRFEEVCALARAELVEMDLTPERLKGANLVISTLTTFANNEDAPSRFPSPGLHHTMPDLKHIEPTKTT